MTTGQRISDKRKELGLSQEALGERLGVSRQSIYKWESDASLPDIDKLITLSRLFGVTVGWLLGVEESVHSGEYVENAPADTPDEKQEQLIEEVLRRYRDSRPEPRKLSKALTIGLLLVCGVLLSTTLSLNTKLDRLNSKYRALEASIDQISTDTAAELDQLTGRMEEILQEQNALALDYTCSVKSYDLSGETVTLSLRIVPKTYVEGMAVLFRAESGGEHFESPGALGDGHDFSAELTIPLTDDIQVSAALIDGDTQQVQPLADYAGMYSDFLPCYEYEPRDTAVYAVGDYAPDGSYRVGEQYVYFSVDDDLTQYKTDFGVVRMESAEVGLFLNRELVQWLSPSKRPAHFEGVSKNLRDSWDDFFHDGYTFFHSPAADGLQVEAGDVLFFAARFTDEFGRQYMVPCENRYVMRGGQFVTLPIGTLEDYLDPADYQF